MDSHIVVRSDAQILGDLPSGSVAKTSFSITIPEDAKAGEYQVPLVVTYQYLDMATQTGLDEISYSFKNEKKSLFLPLTIRRAVRLNVESVDTGDLSVGGEGNIVINVSNTGSDDGKETVFYMEPVGSSPIVPYQDSIYVGNFAKGAHATVSFKVSVSPDANTDIQYPLKLWAEYFDYQGLLAQTSKKDVSAGFKPKVSFTIVSPPSSIASGSKGTISVEYKNVGSTTVYDAQAGVNIVDPFTSEDDQAYLGTIPSGQTATALFKLNVNSGSTPKQYGLDSAIRYTDINQTAYVSDPIKVPVNVTEPGMDLTIFGIVLLVVVVAGGFFYYRHMQQR